MTSEQWIREQIENCDFLIEKIKGEIIKENFVDPTQDYINAHFTAMQKERKRALQEVLE